MNSTARRYVSPGVPARSMPPALPGQSIPRWPSPVRPGGREGCSSVPEDGALEELLRRLIDRGSADINPGTCSGIVEKHGSFCPGEKSFSGSFLSHIHQTMQKSGREDTRQPVQMPAGGCWYHLFFEGGAGFAFPVWDYARTEGDSVGLEMLARLWLEEIFHATWISFILGRWIPCWLLRSVHFADLSWQSNWPLSMCMPAETDGRLFLSIQDGMRMGIENVDWWVFGTGSDNVIWPGLQPVARPNMVEKSLPSTPIRNVLPGYLQARGLPFLRAPHAWSMK